MVPGGKAAASAPLVAIPLLGSVSLGISSEQSCKGRTSSWGSHGNSSHVLVSSWEFCPGGCGCIVLKISFSLFDFCSSCCQTASLGGFRPLKMMQVPGSAGGGCLSPASSSRVCLWVNAGVTSGARERRHVAARGCARCQWRVARLSLENEPSLARRRKAVRNCTHPSPCIA